jgi:DNA-binding transcriptional LysR family regulator
LETLKKKGDMPENDLFNAMTGEFDDLGYKDFVELLLRLEVAGKIRTTSLSRGKKRVELVRLDAQKLPFRNACFGTVVAMEILYYLPHPDEFLDECRRILADMEDAEQALRGTAQDPSGLLRVTAAVLFGQLHVAPVVDAFLACHRRTQVELILLDRVVSLVEEGIDLAVRIGPLSDSSMVAVPVGQIRRVAVASPALLAAAGTPAHPQDLGSLPCVRFTALMPGTTWHFIENGRALAIEVAGRFACNQAATCVDACVAGLGFGLFLSYQVCRPLEAGQLKEVLTDFEPPPLPVSLVLPHTRWLAPRVRVCGCL